MTNRAPLAFGLLALLAAVVAGCRGETAPPPAADEARRQAHATNGETSDAPAVSISGSCVLSVVYRGNRYWEGTVTVHVVPRESGPLGTGVIPDCNDTGGEPGPGDEIELTALEGVPPDVALLWHERPDTVLVREGFENRLPAELRRQTPTCDPADEPIRLAGPWFGLFGRGNPEDVDLTAPYKVKVFAAESSARRYERAFLVARVPAGLERPLTRDDLRWLWEGTIELTVVCRDGRYVAQSVSAHPPG